jgi:hypothetical protein
VRDFASARDASHRPGSGDDRKSDARAHDRNPALGVAVSDARAAMRAPAQAGKRVDRLASRMVNERHEPMGRELLPRPPQPSTSRALVDSRSWAPRVIVRSNHGRLFDRPALGRLRGLARVGSLILRSMLASTPTVDLGTQCLQSKLAVDVGTRCRQSLSAVDARRGPGSASSSGRFRRAVVSLRRANLGRMREAHATHARTSHGSLSPTSPRAPSRIPGSVHLRGSRTCRSRSCTAGTCT